MKVRTGFVSNSSSSSFIIIGRKAKEEDFKTDKDIFILGDYLNEGQEVIEVDEELRKYIAENGIPPNGECIVAGFYSFDSGFDKDARAKIKALMEDPNTTDVTFEIRSGDADYHDCYSNDGLTEFVSKYYSGEGYDEN